jgi:hypothetical protein
MKRQEGIIYYQKRFPLLQPAVALMVVCLKEQIVI